MWKKKLKKAFYNTSIIFLANAGISLLIELLVYVIHPQGELYGFVVSWILNSLIASMGITMAIDILLVFIEKGKVAFKSNRVGFVILICVLISIVIVFGLYIMYRCNQNLTMAIENAAITVSLIGCALLMEYSIQFAYKTVF